MGRELRKLNRAFLDAVVSNNKVEIRRLLKAGAEELLRRGINPNARNVDGESAHDLALSLVAYGNVQIHLVDYKMPDGTIGRGFVNDNLTWSFLGDPVNLINDDDLFVAYCGWAWLFPALQQGTVQTTFVSSGRVREIRLLKFYTPLPTQDITCPLSISCSVST